MTESFPTVFENLSSEKKNRILNAGIQEFSANGYQTASMNKVVAIAGISKGSLFHYFKTKSGLFLCVYGMALDLVKQYLRNVQNETADEPFFIRLEKIMHAGVEFIDAHPRLARIYFHTLYTSDSPHSREILLELRELSGGYLTEIIKDGIDRKELDETLDIERAVFILDSVLNRFLKMSHESSQSVKPEEWVESMCKLFKNGMSSS